jgi:hypothetical protein
MTPTIRELRISGQFLLGTRLAWFRPTLKVRILRTPNGKIDGVDITAFRQGLVYDLATPVASLLICEGWAEPAEPFKIPENVERRQQS